MTGVTVDENKRNFTLSTDIFHQPNLDIYSQMVYIILASYLAESSLPKVADIAKLGRMEVKQATKALQSLVEHKLLPHKVFRQMVGEFADDRLSWAARGLLTYFKQNPQIRINELLELSNGSGEDEHSIRKALRDLKRYGYLEDFPELSRMAN